MRHLRWANALGCVLALALSAAALGARPPAEAAEGGPAELYRQLRDVSIDPSQVYLVRNARITRGGVSIYFNRGFIGFLHPVAGRVTGAAFSGDGEILLLPPNPVEGRSLARFIHTPILEERFTSAYLRFTDGTEQELLQKSRRPDPDDPEQPTGFAELWNREAEPLNAEFSIRILADLLGAQNLPFFHIQIDGASLGRFEFADDERAPEAVRVSAVRHKEGRVFADVWCSYPSPQSRSRQETLAVGSVRVNSYKVQTNIGEDNSLEGRAELDLESLSNADRVLVFDLSRQLRVLRVTNAEGKNLVVLPPPSEDAAEDLRQRDWVAVVLDHTHPTGSKFRLTFTYRGNVITDEGNGVLYVGARGSWYPNRNGTLPASYDLAFRYPDRLTLVATGRCAEQSSANGWKHSRWVSDGPFPVAGFNLGAYYSRVRKVGNVSIEVYATRDAEEALEKRLAAERPSIVLLPTPGPGRSEIKVVPAPPLPPLDPAALLDQVTKNAADAVRYFSELFGPFPYSRLALAQIPGSFGQGWPELVYLPTLSFLPNIERSKLGRRRYLVDLESGLFVTHEIAHQWWGNAVGWASYHDQWISEGFATYAAALALARDKDGEQKFRDLMRGYRDDLLSKTSGGNTIESGGPIWLGHRLSSSVDPRGYDSIIYRKSCWVLHMLRKMMTDPRTGSDEKFFKMLRDFVTAYSSQSPSTEDFLRHADRYMTPAMDLDHNHRLDWFFADWVYGTGIPTYELNVRTRRLAANRYEVEGSVEQSDVPDDFEMLVPIVAGGSKDRKIVLLGRVPVSSTGGRFRFTTDFRPSRVMIDGDQLLAVVK